MKSLARGGPKLAYLPLRGHTKRTVSDQSLIINKSVSASILIQESDALPKVTLIRLIVSKRIFYDFYGQMIGFSQ